MQRTPKEGKSCPWIFLGQQNTGGQRRKRWGPTFKKAGAHRVTAKPFCREKSTHSNASEVAELI